MEFKLESKVNGVAVVPQNIGFGELLTFTKEVGEFIRGSESPSVLDQVHVEFEKGSFVVKAFLSAALMAGVETDYKILEQGQNLGNVDKNRLAVIIKWQKRARQDTDFNVSILPSENTSLTSISISSDTNFREEDRDLWVKVERYLTGEIYTQGGKNKVNIHLTTESGLDMILDTTQEYLSSKKISMYKAVNVHIEALENVRTHELKNKRLIEITGQGPSYDENELNDFIKKGTAAWRDVNDISKWVAEQRGRVYG